MKSICVCMRALSCAFHLIFHAGFCRSVYSLTQITSNILSLFLLFNTVISLICAGILFIIVANFLYFFSLFFSFHQWRRSRMHARIIHEITLLLNEFYFPLYRFTYSADYTHATHKCHIPNSNIHSNNNIPRNTKRKTRS